MSLLIETQVNSFLHFSALFGGPWICAATVRAVSHVSALLVVSTNVVPGESAKVKLNITFLGLYLRDASLITLYLVFR